MVSAMDDGALPTDRPIVMDGGMREVIDACVPMVSESEMAKHLRCSGQKVVLHRGHFWEAIQPGFFRPVNLLARLSAWEATRPTLACWGYQACLTQADAHHANAASPAYLVEDFDGFKEELLPTSRRYKLNKARRRAHLVQLTGPSLLREQGYEVLRSSQERTGYGAIPTRDQYLAALEFFGEPADGIVLAGLVEGKLGGYITGFAVDGTAYVQSVVVSTEFLKTEMSTGLTYEFIYACMRSPGISTMVHGLHTPENAGLCRYKEWMDLPVRRVPARISMLPGAAKIIRRRAPHKFYRLTGRA